MFWNMKRAVRKKRISFIGSEHPFSSVIFIISVDSRERKTEKRATDEQRLYKYLMRNYDPNTRPVFNASHPVNVSIGITLTQIFDVVSMVNLV